MAETQFSPGVVSIENDQPIINTQPIQVGAAIIGPTVKGPVEIPTICTSYSDYVSKYGNTFTSGSQTYSYFTSISAYNYFQAGGTTLLVSRVTSGSFTPATSISTGKVVKCHGIKFDLCRINPFTISYAMPKLKSFLYVLPSCILKNFL